MAQLEENNSANSHLIHQTAVSLIIICGVQLLERPTQKIWTEGKRKHSIKREDRRKELPNILLSSGGPGWSQWRSFRINLIFSRNFSKYIWLYDMKSDDMIWYMIYMISYHEYYFHLCVVEITPNPSRTLTVSKFSWIDYWSYSCLQKVIIILTHCEIFMAVFTDVLSLKSETQQVSSVFRTLLSILAKCRNWVFAARPPI